MPYAANYREFSINAKQLDKLYTKLRDPSRLPAGGRDGPTKQYDKAANDQKQAAPTTDTKAKGKPKPRPAPKPADVPVSPTPSTPTPISVVVLQEPESESVCAIDVSLPQDEEEFPLLRADLSPATR